MHLPAVRRLDSLPLRAHPVYMFALQGVAQLRLDPALVRQQVRQCHTKLDQSAAAWLHRTPFSSGWSFPVRLYVHALLVEDITVQSVLRGNAPLFTWLWPDVGGPADTAALSDYARAVYGSTEAYLARLTSDGLSQVLDLSRLGLGQRTVAWIIRRFVLVELAHISSAISGAAVPTSTPGARHSLPDGSQRSSHRNLPRRATHDIHAS